MVGWPVVRTELVRVARQRRFFVTRLLFGLALLAVLAINDLDQAPGRSLFRAGRTSINELARFGAANFAGLVVAQIGLVTVLTPALVAGTIADERQRRTLHDLLTTCLSGHEIVLGKLAARLLHAGAYLAIVVPIASLLTLSGGVDPGLLAWSFAATASTAFFLAGLGVLVSTTSRRTREAVTLAYLLTASWLFLPWIVATLARGALGTTWEAVGLVVDAAATWAADSTPFVLTGPLLGSTSRGAVAGLDWVPIARMIALQVGSGAILAGLASWQLRPAFRRIESHAPRRPRRLARIGPRPPCGADPVYWKEAHASRDRGRAARWLAVILGSILGLALVGGTAYFAWVSVVEVFRTGSIADESRESFHLFLQVVGTATFVLWMLNLGSLAAGLITTERERDTWTSLLTTPLSGAEIVRGKMLGVLRSTAGFGVAIIAPWGVGLMLGAVHPIGFALALAGLALFAWFVLALGTYCSLRSKTTWRSQMATVGIMVGLNSCCLNPLPSPVMMVPMLLASYDPAEFFRGPAPVPGLVRPGMLMLGMGVYAIAAFMLTRSAVLRFDVIADRPRVTIAAPARGGGAGG